MFNNQSLLNSSFSRVKQTATALTDLSYIRWTSYKNQSDFNLFIGASRVNNVVDLYSYNGSSEYSVVAHVNRYAASSQISSLSTARHGIIAYGCNNGSYGLLEIKKQNGNNFLWSNKSKSVDTCCVSGIDVIDNRLIMGTSKGKLICEDFGSEGTMLIESDTPIQTIHAYTSYNFVVGHQCGRVGVWDLREREKNVFNSSTKKNYRVAHSLSDGVTTCHMKNDCIVVAGTSEGYIKFADMRYTSQKYPCTLKVSKKAITCVQFSETSNSTVLVTCSEGYLELVNDELMSLWFNSEELDVSPWLKGDHFDRLQFGWLRDIFDPVAVDSREKEIIIASNTGDLCFITPKS